MNPLRDLAAYATPKIHLSLSASPDSTPHIAPLLDHGLFVERLAQSIPSILTTLPPAAIPQDDFTCPVFYYGAYFHAEYELFSDSVGSFFWSPIDDVRKHNPDVIVVEDSPAPTLTWFVPQPRAVFDHPPDESEVPWRTYPRYLLQAPPT